MISYATREDVKEAADFKDTARADRRIDRALAAATLSINSLCHRRFYPQLDTRLWDWPNGQYARPWRLWLDQNELISVTSVTSGGVLVPADTVLLEPQRYGPPYNQVQLDISKTSGFTQAGTHQQQISITGLFGYRDDQTSVGAVTVAVDGSQTTLTVDGPASAELGVGNLIRVDDERCTVVGRQQLDTGQTIGADLAVKASDVSVIVQDGTVFVPGETVLVDSERMLIVDIAGNSLSVRRSWDGSTLAAHTTGATVWAPRTLTVRRAVLGTTATTHASGATVQRWDPPALIRQLAIAEALVTAGLESSSYSKTARSSGSSGTERPKDTSGIDGLRVQVYDAHGRKARLRGV